MLERIEIEPLGLVTSSLDWLPSWCIHTHCKSDTSSKASKSRCYVRVEELASSMLYNLVGKRFGRKRSTHWNCRSQLIAGSDGAQLVIWHYLNLFRFDLIISRNRSFRCHWKLLIRELRRQVRFCIIYFMFLDNGSSITLRIRFFCVRPQGYCRLFRGNITYFDDISEMTFATAFCVFRACR